jgi:hypothetical protein
LSKSSNGRVLIVGNFSTPDSFAMRSAFGRRRRRGAHPALSRLSDYGEGRRRDRLDERGIVGGRVLQVVRVVELVRGEVDDRGALVNLGLLVVLADDLECRERVGER